MGESMWLSPIFIDVSLLDFELIINCIPRDPDGSVANAFKLVPDWTVEILSPDQSQTKVVRNILHVLKSYSQDVPIVR